MNGWNDYYEYLDEAAKKSLAEAEKREDISAIEFQTIMPHCCGTCQNCTATWDNYFGKDPRCIFREGALHKDNRAVGNLKKESCPDWKLSSLFVDDFNEDMAKIFSKNDRIIIREAEDCSPTM